MTPMTILSFALTLLCFGFNHATDPVYSPLTLSDSVGNSANSDASITWASLPTGTPLAASSPERVEPALEPYQNMVNGFIDMVFASGIPKSAIEKAANNDLNIDDVANNYQEYQSYLMGYVICVGIGLLFVPIFMIVVCCMCCCRCCCGNCGGKRQQPEAEAKNLCRKYAFVIVLGVVVAFLVILVYILWAVESDLYDSIISAADGIGDNFENLTEQMKIYVLSNTDQYPTSLVLIGVCIGLGILFLQLFIIVVCCFGCCQCCGNRHQTEKDADNTCRKSSFAIVLMVVMVLLVAASGIILTLNDSVSDSIDTIPTTVDNNMQDVKIYVNNTVDKINHIATTNFQFMMSAINRDLENDSIAFLVGIPLRTDIETNTNIRTTLNDAYSLATDLETADTALTDVETKNSELQTSITALDSALTAWRNNVDTIFTNCAGSCPTPQPNTNANTGVDPSQFPDLTSARNSMDNAIAANLTAKLIDAEQELDTVPDTVAEKSYSTRNSLQNTTADLSDDLDSVTNEIRDIQDEISGDGSSIDNFADDVDSMIDDIKPYDKYRWYAFLGISVLVLACAVIALLGIGCGVLGTCTPISPEKRGCVPHCGGCLLVMFSVMSSILLLFILMFLTIPLFAIGPPLHAFICKPLTDLDYMAELWGIYNDAKVGAGNSYMGDVLHGNKTIQMTPTGVLRDCDNGRSFWSTFRFDQKFDLDDLLNYSKTLDVQSEIDTVNVDLSSVEVYPTDLQNQLTDASDAINIDFNAFYQELAESPTNTDLAAMADDIDQYVNNNNIPSPYDTNFTNAANDLRTINATEYVDVALKITALNTSVANMETAVSPMPTKITNLQTGLQTADDFIQNNGSDIVKPHLNTYADRLISIVESYKTFTIDAIENQLGDCKPVWNLYNSFIVYTFCYNFIDLFTGSWFVFGWCSFCFFLGFIFSLKLSKYFLRMTEDNKVGPDPGEKPGIVDPVEVHVLPEIRKHRQVQLGTGSKESDW